MDWVRFVRLNSICSENWKSGVWFRSIAELNRTQSTDWVRLSPILERSIYYAGNNQKFKKFISEGFKGAAYVLTWNRCAGSGRMNIERRNAHTCSPAQPWCGGGLELVRSPRSTCCFDLENGVRQLKVSSHSLLYNIKSQWCRDKISISCCP